MPSAMWRSDPLEQAHLRLPGGIVMHREAGKRGWSCLPKLSNIDKRYFAEIDSLKQHNVKLGRGDTPIEAASNGYRQVMPDDLDMRMFCLVAEAEALVHSANDHIGRLSTALAQLERVHV